MAREYYLVAPLAAGGSKTDTFTYHADARLQVGQIVQVTLGPRTGHGVVMGKTAKPTFATKAINELAPLPPLPKHLVELAKWISWHYVTPLGRVWQTMLPSSLYLKRDKPIESESMAAPQPPHVKLTDQQQAAIEQITKVDQSRFLLYGATGSGKTLVYIELAQRALGADRSTILLVPEISLTPQLATELTKYFGSNIVLTHSGLTLAERRVAWQRVLRAEEPLVILGPRSALFMPVPKPGLIVLDEAHDSSYKQDQAPRYMATTVSTELDRLTGANLVLGTATPSVADLFAATKHALRVVRMPQPVHKIAKTKPQIVDLRQRELLTTSPLLSNPLIDAIKSSIDKGKQAIIFLNRRGNARSLLCTNCDFIAKCPNCQIPLTWHADEGKLRCHWCGHIESPPATCPLCGHMELKFVGSGTKRLEQEIARLFPKARLLRLDRDSLDPKTLPALYADLASGKFDILLGTQMITKGLDLPGVETIGIAMADTMLFLPDWSASERTWQLLYQVSGRAGRRAGSSANVVIQTYSPDHPIIQTAAAGDFAAFAKAELDDRKLLKYPPFVHLMKLMITKPTRAAAQAASTELVRLLKPKNAGKPVEIIGPAPAWRETLGGKYHWQIVVKAKNREDLVQMARTLPAGWSHDLDPLDLL